MAVYALALGYSNGIAPLIMGFINMGQGWRWVFVSSEAPFLMDDADDEVLVRNLLWLYIYLLFLFYGRDQLPS